MHDVLIIGGGPAGSTAATLLAARGLDVLVLEREHFPREHVGESLLPATLAVLEQIGVLPAVQAAGFTVKRGATMRWGESTAPWSWYFAETNQRFPHSYQVWRPQFDAILLDHARASGARVRCGVAVTRVLFDTPGADDIAGGPPANGALLADGSRVQARAVIDASGQRALLARQRNLLEFDACFRNLAIYGYFAGGERLRAPDDGNIFIESYAQGWCWNIPLSHAEGPWSSVGFVMDRDRALPQLQSTGAAAMFREQLLLTAHTRRMLAPAELVRGPFVQQDWSYRARQFAGNGWVLAGDAACFIDPLFSTGVHLAVTAGLLGAALAVSMLSDAAHRPAVANPGGGPAAAPRAFAALGPAAADTYTQLYTRQYEHFRRLAQLFYAGNRSMDSYFWAARRLLGEGGQAQGARESFIRAVSGQTPAGYERSVLAHGDLPPAFVAALDSVQRGRAERRAALDAQRSELPGLRPVRAAGVAIEQRAVLGDGQFEWGEVIVAQGRDDPVPCSALVSALVRHADGVRSLDDIAAAVVPDVALRHAALASLCAAAEVLYVDGLLTALV